MATYGTFANGVSLKASEANDFLVWTSFSPVVKQSSTLNIQSSTQAKYAKVNKFVFVKMSININQTGVGGNKVTIDLPVNASSTSIGCIGIGYFGDSSASDLISACPVIDTASTIAFLTNASTSLTSFIGATGPNNVELAVGDGFVVFLRYEAA